MIFEHDFVIVLGLTQISMDDLNASSLNGEQFFSSHILVWGGVGGRSTHMRAFRLSPGSLIASYGGHLDVTCLAWLNL